MARIRSIHPDALKSRKLAAAGLAAETCYWRLQTVCDDEGRCEDDPRLLWHTLFPQHDDVDDGVVDGMLDALALEGLIVRYEAGGVRYLAVVRFGDFQHPQRPKPSLIPAPSANGTHHVRDDDATDRVHALPGEGEGGEKERETRDAPAAPSRVASGPRRKRPLTPVPETFELTDERLEWCRENCPNLDAVAATQEWLTSCKAKDFRYANWDAAWQNAMRRATRWHKTSEVRR